MPGADVPWIENFPPVFDSEARILILGSMPGRVSLEANEYYAHPRNHFWRLMESILGIPRELSYKHRLEAIKGKGVALWDSAWRCVRHASADSTMEEIRASDFAMLFREAPRIQAIFFNGRKSEEVFRRYALAELPDRMGELPMCYLPSTSPANAGMSSRGNGSYGPGSWITCDGGSEPHLKPEPGAPRTAAGPVRPRFYRMGLTALVIFAVLRLLLFQAAFPPFSQVDEILHWDTIQKYASLELPGGALPAFQEEVLDQYLLYESKEYIEPGPVAPHPMLAPADLRDIHVKAQKPLLRKAPNYMAWEPPLYYVGAAAWVKLGSLVGIQGIDLFFWARAFSALLYAGLILASARFVRTHLPERDFLAMAVPLLLAVLPQDLYYQVSDDVPSALLLVLGFDRLLCLDMRGRARDFWMAGLCFGALLLTKPTNLPTMILPAFFLVPRLCKSLTPGGERADRRDLLFWASLILPVLLWAIYSKVAGDEWLSSRHKMAFHGFIPRGPFGILEHPGLSLGGFVFFFTGLFSTFWTGEFWWKGKLLAWAWLDALLSLALIFLVGLSWSGRSRVLPALPDRITRPLRWLILGSVAFLILSSLMLEFPDRPVHQPPSQKEPFFRVYRLISATLFPVLLFLSDGMERLADLLVRPALRWILLALFCLTLLASEFWMSSSVFASAYNWFHLPR